jgi:hypothetical protein
MTGLAPCAVRPDAPERGCTCEPCSAAEENGRRVSKRMRDGAAVDLATRDTLNEWIERWFEDREVRGLTSVGDDRSRYRHHVADFIGSKPMAGPDAVSRDDLEMLVEDLDRKARLPTGEGDATPGRRQ